MTAYFSLVHLFYVVVLVFDFVALVLLVKCNDSTLVIAISKHFGDDGTEAESLGVVIVLQHPRSCGCLHRLIRGGGGRFCWGHAVENLGELF